jgi:pimeloyl-ACP methyl ester carboxylesterase
VPREQLKPVIDREASPSFGARERRAAFDEMLGATARPATRERVLAALDRIDPPAFAALRRSLFEFRDARAGFAGYQGPAVAVEAAGSPYAAVMAGQVLGLPRTEVQGVSHWLQFDDPEAVNRALDAFLARQVGVAAAARRGAHDRG